MLRNKGQKPSTSRSRPKKKTEPYEIPLQFINTTDEEIKIRPYSLMIRVDEVKDIKPMEIPTITEDEKRQLLDLIIEYKDVFAKHDYDLTECTAVKHPIPFLNETPIKQKCFRYAQCDKEICDEEIEKMLKAGVIETSCSPWLSPVVLVKKKDGSTRFCIDYRKLNAKTKKDTFPLPDINDMLQSLHVAKYFTTCGS